MIVSCGYFDIVQEEKDGYEKLKPVAAVLLEYLCL